MAKEAESTFKEVLPQTSLTNSVKLLPWCISSAVPLHYMNEALTTAVQWEEDVPMTTTVPKPEGTQFPDPTTSLAHHTGTPPPLVPLLLDIPFVGTSHVGCPFAGFIVSPMQKKQNCSPTDTLGGTMLTPKRLSIGGNTAVYRAMRTYPHWHKRLGPAPNHKGRNPLVPLPVQPRPPLIPTILQWWEP